MRRAAAICGALLVAGAAAGVARRRPRRAGCRHPSRSDIPAIWHQGPIRSYGPFPAPAPPPAAAVALDQVRRRPRDRLLQTRARRHCSRGRTIPSILTELGDPVHGVPLARRVRKARRSASRNVLRRGADREPGGGRADRDVIAARPGARGRHPAGRRDRLDRRTADSRNRLRAGGAADGRGAGHDSCTSPCSDPGAKDSIGFTVVRRPVPLPTVECAAHAHRGPPDRAHPSARVLGARRRAPRGGDDQDGGPGRRGARSRPPRQSGRPPRAGHPRDVALPRGGRGRLDSRAPTRRRGF